MLIGRRLKEFRLRYGLSLEQLDGLSGLGLIYLSRLEQGLEVPSYADLEILSDVLGCPLEYFVRDGDKPVLTPRLTPRLTLEELAVDRPASAGTRVRSDGQRSSGASAAFSHATANAQDTNEPSGKSMSSWAQTRIGQVALFWGVLQLVLKVADSAAKLDMLKMLRESLVSELQFLVDPRVALLFVAVAVFLLWGSNRGQKSTKLPVADDSGKPEPKRNPVFGATAVPFFLALVCGVSLVAVDWQDASSEHAVHLTASAPSLDLSLQEDTASPARKRPARALSLSSGRSSSSGRAEPLARSLPPLNPELDQPDQRATITGSLSQLVKGLGAVASHSSQAAPSSLAPSRNAPSAAGARKRTLDRIEQAQRQQNWRLMATLSEDAIAQNPQWLTPYELAGEAYVHLGDIDRAIARLEYVKMSGAGSLGDGWAVIQAARLRESIRHQYGR